MLGSHSTSPSDLCRKRKTARLLDSLHMLRDGNSFNFLSSCVMQQYTNCGLIFNFPPDVYSEKGPKLGPPPRIVSEDLLILATRPPLLDNRKRERRRIIKSDSELETVIFEQLSNVFDRCTRQYVLLNRTLAENLDANASTYGAVRFNINNNAFYNRRGHFVVGSIADRIDDLNEQKVKQSKKNLGYLVYIPNIPFGNSPFFLTSFGMNGTSNLLWNFIVKTYLYEDVQNIVDRNRPHIIVGEFSMDLSDSYRPSYLSTDLVSRQQKIIDMDFELL